MVISLLTKCWNGITKYLDDWCAAGRTDQASDTTHRDDGTSGVLTLYRFAATQPVSMAAGAKLTARIVREVNDMLPIYEKTKRYLLLEKVKVTTQHREGGPPCWRFTKLIEAHAIGVHTWRSVNGAWIEGFYRRRGQASFTTHRVRMVDGANRMPGVPQYVELYDIIGDADIEIDLSVADLTAQLLASINRAEKEAGIK